MEYYYTFAGSKDIGVLNVAEREGHIDAIALINPVQNISAELGNNSLMIDSNHFTLVDGLYSDEELITAINNFGRGTFEIRSLAGRYSITSSKNATVVFHGNLGPVVGLPVDGTLNLVQNISQSLTIDAFMGASHFIFLGLGLPITARRIFIEYSKPKRRRLFKNVNFTIYYPKINRLHNPVYGYDTRVTLFLE